MTKLTLFPLLVCLLASACASAPSGPIAESDPTAVQLRERMLKLDGEVKAITGEAACATDAECDVVGYGVKGCGGPVAYLPFSTRSSDVAELGKKVEAFNETAREFNRKTQLMSNCALTTRPEVGCVERHCRTK